MLLRRLVPAAFVLALVGGVGLVPAGAQEEEGPAEHEQVVDITFPLAPGATYIDDYDHGRSGGRAHRATDVFADKLSKVYAAVEGTITWIPGVEDGESKPSYGYMIRIAGDDGRGYSYIHLNDDTPGTSDASAGPEWAYAPGLRQGSRVERGQWIGYVGDSGNAKGASPHLHFAISDPDVTDPYGSTFLNPYFSLQAAEERRDYPSEPHTADVDRLAGPERVGTAVALSKASFEGPVEHAVIAAATSFPDAIVAGPLAAALGGPVLTTYGHELDGRVADELRRLAVGSVTVVGPPERVPDDVMTALAGVVGLDPGQVRRVAGDTDAHTAAQVAELVWARTGSTGALVALSSHPQRGRDWPDALTGGALGAMTGVPVLLTDHHELPQVTRDAIDGLQEVLVVGGTKAIPAAQEEAIAAHVPLVRRLSGPDRYGTAVAVAEEALAAGASVRRVWAATGRNYADALAAATAVSAAGEVLLLVDGKGEGGDAHAASWLAGRASTIEGAVIIGGSEAVGHGAEIWLRTLISSG